VLELRFGSVGALRVRFAISPAEELLAAIRTVAMPSRQPLHRPWSTQAAATLRKLDVDDLAATISSDNYFPDFLSPPPSTPTTTIDEQLDGLRATRDDQVETELALSFEGRVRPRGLQHARRARALLGEQMERCWRGLLEPIWPRVLDVLRADIDYRGRLYADGGVERALSGLHRSLRVEPDRVLVDEHHPCPQQELDDRGLLLIPRAFGFDGIGPMLLAPWPPALIYPARGRGVLWRAPQGPVDGLARAFGRTKAVLLVELVTPSSTTALARRLTLSPSSVSAHLRDLEAGGLLKATGHGRHVFYGLSEIGRAVVER